MTQLKVAGLFVLSMLAIQATSNSAHAETVNLERISNAAVCEFYWNDGRCKTWYSYTKELAEYNSMFAKFVSIDRYTNNHEDRIGVLEAKIAKLENLLKIQNEKLEAVVDSEKAHTSTASIETAK